MKPDEGDIERGIAEPVKLLGANESCGASVLEAMPRFGAIYKML